MIKQFAATVLDIKIIKQFWGNKRLLQKPSTRIDLAVGGHRMACGNIK